MDLTKNLKPLLLLCLVTAQCLAGSYANQQPISKTETQCPAGSDAYLPGICITQPLDPDVVQPLLTTGRCEQPNAYEHILGTAFCLANHHSLTMVNRMYLVDGPVKQHCGPFFSREPGKTSCIDDALALSLVKGQLTLLMPQLNCPQGFEQQARATVCTPIDQGSAHNQHAFTPDCVAGFLKPPGAPRCLSNEIIKNTNAKMNYGVIPAIWPCPASFIGEPGAFCQPSHMVFNRGDSTRMLLVKIRCECPDSVGGYFPHPDEDQDGELYIRILPVLFCAGPAEGVGINCPDLGYTL
jgi:hypothetical protein